jgi:hypothetical protein
MEPIVARKTWRTLEPIHGMIYFAPEAASAYAAIGLAPGPMGYFASRSAALGAVPPEAVVATFFNFDPRLVRQALPGAWTITTPAAVLEARLHAADAALRRVLPAGVLGSAEVAEAAGLARLAAETATHHVGGRPLFAAHAALPWPDDPHLVLWHAQTLLREYRGDGHVAALVLAGLDPVEALVTHAATGEVAAPVLQATRGWDDEHWSRAVESLRARGVLAGGEKLEFTPAGAALRRQVEEQTDAAALAPYAALGDERCARLRARARPLSTMLVEAGSLAPRR